MKPRPSVGDKLFIVSLGYRRGPERDKQPLIPCKVSKVGTKFFTIETADAPHGYTATFQLDGWREKTDFQPLHYLYSSEQERADEIERRRVWEVLRQIFSGGIGSTDRSKSIRLETLLEIEGIIINEKSDPSDP